MARSLGCLIATTVSLGGIPCASLDPVMKTDLDG